MNYKDNLPKHVAIILDGNGRWAQKRNLPRSEGHRKGGENLRKLLDVLLEIHIPYVSLYTFSTENWKRPEKEILALWKLMKEFFSQYLEEAICKGISIRVSGDISKLPKENQNIINESISKTKKNKKLVANFCINYGSHKEILYAINQIVLKKLNSNKKNYRITEKDIERHLYTYPLPPVDLLIRSGGEHRISNFLLWQSAYAEIYFTDVLWPDFSREDLVHALNWFAQRERRYGGLKN